MLQFTLAGFEIQHITENRTILVNFEYVSHRGNTQQWRSASLALEVV
jgi:hypothetical protein